MQTLGNFLVKTPLFSIFICLFLGYLIGEIKFGKDFKLGATVGVLIVSLIIGQVGYFTRDQLLGAIFFDAFMFSVGYRVGPSFITSMKRFGGKIVGLSLVFLFFAFMTAFVLFKAFNIGPGVAAGTIAGALTQSAVIGSSLTTISNMPISSSLKATYEAQVPIVYALTYVFGTIGVLIFLRDIAPRLLHIDIKKQSTKVAREMKFQQSFPSPTRIRSFKVMDNSQLVGKKLREANADLSNSSIILSVFNQNGKITDATYELRGEDVVTMAGYLDDIALNTHKFQLQETSSPKKAPVERKFVLGKNYDKSQLEVLEKNNIFVNFYDSVTGELRTPASLKHNDIVSLAGNFKDKKIVNTLNEMGRWRSSDLTINYGIFSLGLALSALFGLIGVKVNGINLQLGEGTAALILGLVLSIWSDKNQNISRIPDRVAMFFQSYGLNLFIVTVGLNAARTFTSAFQSLGVGVFLIGAAISIVPQILSLYVGKWLFKMEPVALIGSLSGADTLSAALNAISVKAGDEGGPYYAATFTPAYVVGNIILTLLGPIFLVLLS